MRTSRRSGAALLAATRMITRRMPVPRLPADKVRAHREPAAVRDGGRVEVHTYPTPGAELDNIADLLRRAHLEDGIPWSDMAVLVRAGSRLPTLRRALTAAGVPLDRGGGEQAPHPRDPRGGPRPAPPAAPRPPPLAPVPRGGAPPRGPPAPAARAPRGAPGARDPYFPLSGNGGYDVRHYDLTLGYDTGSRRLDGTAVLTARATQELTRFDLDLTGLKVTAVTVDRAQAAFRRDGQELVVTPRHALRRNQEFRVTVAYHGTPEPVTDPDGSTDGWIPTDDGAFVAGQPQGAMTWFPANGHPRDKASYDFTVTVPKGRTAVANGVLLGQRTAHGKTTFHWRATQPMAAYLATASIGKFQVERYTTRDGIQVYNAVDAREARAAAPVLKKLPAVLEWESKLFGPYPFEAAGSIVDHAPDVGYALETQTRPDSDTPPALDTLWHD
ncbi:hypothetical protein, partial [Streptomyces tricolor]